MNDPETCEHDFRRLGYTDINPEAQSNALLWVVCCGCGRTPTGLGEMGFPNFKFLVNGDWPEDHRVTDWTVDEYGPLVEFEVAT